MLTSLNKNLNGYVVGNVMTVNQRAQYLIFRFRSRRKANLNFFKADIYEKFKEIQLFLKIHRRNESLVAIAQIDGTPRRCFFNAIIGPAAVRKRNGGKRNILFAALIHENALLSEIRQPREKKNAPGRYQKRRRGAKHKQSVIARYHPNSAGKADPHGFKQNLTDHGVTRRGLLSFRPRDSGMSFQKGIHPARTNRRLS